VVLGHETAGHVAEVAGRAACLRGQRAALVAGRGRRHRAGDGRGPIGLLHLQLGLGRGARAVIVSDPSQGRRANAERFGATVTVDPASQDLGAVVGEVSRGVGIDSTIVAIGRAELVNQAVGLARVGGRVNLFAGFKGKGLAEVESNLLHYKQVRLTGTSNARRADYETALRMIETGKVDTASMVTHRFPLRSVTEAIETVTTGQAIKVAVLP
jgi:L-iditol 2-dehydrogenase